jgi:hypothetical protein
VSEERLQLEALEHVGRSWQLAFRLPTRRGTSNGVWLGAAREA